MIPSTLCQARTQTLPTGSLKPDAIQVNVETTTCQWAGRFA